VAAGGGAPDSSAATAHAHLPLRPRVDDATHAETARGVAAGGGAPDSSAATGRSQFPFSRFSQLPTGQPALNFNQPAFDLVGPSRVPSNVTGAVGFGSSSGYGFGSDFVSSASELRNFNVDAPVNFFRQSLPGASTNERRVPNTPPPPVRPPAQPPGSIFLRARRFRHHAIQACSDLDGQALVGGIGDLCESIDNEMQGRLNSVPQEFFEQEWQQAGLDLSAALVEATGSTPAAVSDSLNANEGDPSVSLLDLLHSKGNSFIEGCAAEASSLLQAERQSRSLRRFMTTYFPGLDPNSAEGRQTLQSNLPADVLYRILGHSYRPGSRPPFQPPSSPTHDRLPHRSFPRWEEEEQEEDDDGDGGGDSDDEAEAGDKRKTKTSKSRLQPPQQEGKGVRVIKDPMMWVEGTAPDGGFELETFEAVYNDWLSVVSGLEKGSGCTFKSRIDHKLIPGVRGNLLLSPEEWDDIDDDALIAKISKKLNFNHSDYYHSQFDVISMPYPPPDPLAVTSDAEIATDYKVMTNKMLYILDQARKNGVTFRWSNVKRAYKKAIRGYLRLERLFDRKEFNSLDEVVSYSNRKLKKNITLVNQKKHEAKMQARAAGVRSDVGGGKSEPSGATPPRGRGGRGQSRGRGRGGFNIRGGHSQDQAGVHKKDSRGDRDKGPKDEAAAKRLSQAYAKEDGLPRGRYWHKRTPFCPADGACSAKFCQGCGYHGTPGNWHDRPKCRTCHHTDFVKDGYFHEKHPDKLNLFTDKSASLRTMMGDASAIPSSAPSEQAHYRGASGDGKACQHCSPTSGDRSHSRS